MYSRILVPLDGSHFAEAILPHAVEMAKRYEATLVLLRVVLSEAEAVTQTATPEPLAVSPLSIELAEQVVQAQEAAADSYLSRLSAGFAEAGIKFELLVGEGEVRR